MNTVETCFKKLTGVFGDYSEQQFVDCGYGQNGANGCNGASPHAYAKWAGDRNDGLAHESSYPYLNTKPNLYCPKNLPAILATPSIMLSQLSAMALMVVNRTGLSRTAGAPAGETTATSSWPVAVVCVVLVVRSLL